MRARRPRSRRRDADTTHRADGRRRPARHRPRRAASSQRPTVEAAFRLESYRPGDVARLAIRRTAQGRHAADLPRRHRDRARARQRHHGRRSGHRDAPSRQRRARRRDSSPRSGNWPTGFYFAQLEDAGGRSATRRSCCARAGSASTASRSSFRRRRGRRTTSATTTTTASPTRGTATGAISTARLARPFENRGTPRHYR